ncbi:ABC transporter ATP-binding protein [bacterium]|nr:ABC transporter ATP-binding protein [bacterium]
MNNQTGDSKIDIITVEGLKTYFCSNGKIIKAVDDVSFSVAPMQRIGIAGESGSGKTQTMYSIMGLNTGVPGIIDGKIEIHGQDVLRDLSNYCKIVHSDGNTMIKKDVYKWARLHHSRMREIRGSVISMVFQEPKTALSPFFTVGKQLTETLKVRGTEGSASQEMINSLLAKMQFDSIREIMKKYPHQLSGGESQRIMLALALIGQPQVLIADEPTTALDAVIRHRIIDLLGELFHDSQSSLIYVSHNLKVLKEFVEDLIVMYGGRIVEKGPIKDILKEDYDASHPYTVALRSYLNNSNKVHRTHNFQINQAITDRSGCQYYCRCPLIGRVSERQRKLCQNEQPSLLSTSSGHEVACWVKGKL